MKISHLIDFLRDLLSTPPSTLAKSSPTTPLTVEPSETSARPELDPQRLAPPENVLPPDALLPSSSSTAPALSLLLNSPEPSEERSPSVIPFALGKFRFSLCSMDFYLLCFLSFLRKETACPIVGSASFLRARSEGFSAFKSDNIAALNAAGGYECLDTRYSLESCGGCSSMGEFSAGVNCLALPNSSGVGCDNGTCVVFSCKGTPSFLLTASRVDADSVVLLQPTFDRMPTLPPAFKLPPRVVVPTSAHVRTSLVRCHTLRTSGRPSQDRYR